MPNKWIVYLLSLVFISSIWADKESIYYPKKEDLPKNYTFTSLQQQEKQDMGLKSNPGFMGVKGIQMFSAILGLKKGDVKDIFVVIIGQKNNSFGYMVFVCKDDKMAKKIGNDMGKMNPSKDSFMFANKSDLVFFGCDKPKDIKLVRAWSERLKKRLEKDHKIKLIELTNKKPDDKKTVIYNTKPDDKKNIVDDKSGKEVHWLKSIAKGKEEAKRSGQPLLVKIGAKW